MWSFLTISVTLNGPFVTSVAGADAHLSPFWVTTSLRIGPAAGSAASHRNAGSGCASWTWKVKSSTAFSPSVASAASMVALSRCGSMSETLSPLSTASANSVSCGAARVDEPLPREDEVLCLDRRAVPVLPRRSQMEHVRSAGAVLFVALRRRRHDSAQVGRGLDQRFGHRAQDGRLIRVLGLAGVERRRLVLELDAQHLVFRELRADGHARVA